MVFGTGTGGNPSPTEMFVVGQDSTWTNLGDTTNRYANAVTVKNEIYIQG